MHLQQTKRGSLATGGPQYYFHSLTDPVRVYLRQKGAVGVALVTPYGATRTDFFAVSKERKLDSRGRVIEGRVGHDRIQQGQAQGSIGEAIRYWYCLDAGDFERIDVDIDIVDDAFYLTPLRCRYAGRRRRDLELRRPEKPLTFTESYQSPLWREQLRRIERNLLRWSLEEICRVVRDHMPATRVANVLESDLLRASGPLRHLGVSLGALRGRGYDCLTEFQFLEYPPYRVHVEIKKRSADFRYQQRKYGRDELSRAVVLCVVHDHPQLHKHIDVLELRALCDVLGTEAKWLFQAS